MTVSPGRWTALSLVLAVALPLQAQAFTFTGTGPMAWTEGQAAGAVVPGITLACAPGCGGSAFAGGATTASVVISGGFRGGDVLSVTDDGLLTGSYNAATGVLSLASDPSVPVVPGGSAWQALLRTVRFTTTAGATGDPSGTRTLTYTTNNTCCGPDGTTSTVVVSAAAPATPSAPTATAGDARATITVAPAGSGFAPTSHVITAQPGGTTCQIAGASGSCTITGLANGTPSTFTDTAVRYGTASAVSPASAAVTPAAPTPAQSGAGADPRPLRTSVAVRSGVAVTTGPVPAGATSLSQTARQGGAAPSALTAMARPRTVRGSCRIIPARRPGAARTYTCRIRLPRGTWTLTTTARGGSRVLAQAVRRVAVR